MNGNLVNDPYYSKGGNLTCWTNILNDRVFSERSSPSVDLSEPSLVDQLTHCLQIGIAEMAIHKLLLSCVASNSPPGDVWLHQFHHVERCFVETYKHSIVNLTETEQLQNLANAWTYSINTEILKLNEQSPRVKPNLPSYSDHES